MIHQIRSTCRACGSGNLRHFLSLGPMPLANSFLDSPGEFAGETCFPLDVCFCGNCALVQLRDVIDPDVLFSHYLYVTGTSDTIARHNKQYARTISGLLKLDESDLVIEVASNDGSLLRCFKELGIRTLGVDPAKNIAEIARSRGIETLAEFFDSSTAAQIRSSYGPAKTVIGNNVLAHVDDTLDFLCGFRALLDEDGLAVIEMPYLGNLLKGLEYDTIYHEHLCYFSVNTLLYLCDQVGLSLVRLDYFPEIHGGSLRMYAGLPAYYGSHTSEVLDWAQKERDEGMTTFERYRRFARDVQESRRSLLTLLEELTAEGKTIAGYGASAKGTTLINYCGIDTRLVKYTVDKSPLKVGLYMPGMHIPVLPVSTLLERQPDYLLLLAWNFADEIMSQQEVYRNRGGRFIIPIPELRVV